MATRCVIEVEGVEYVKIYKHWDGYPDATLPWLIEFHRTFLETRGIDPEYEFAQLLRSSERDGEKFGLDQSKITGWGVLSHDSRVGAEYLYILKNNGSVETRLDPEKSNTLLSVSPFLFGDEIEDMGREEG